MPVARWIKPLAVPIRPRGLNPVLNLDERDEVGRFGPRLRQIHSRGSELSPVGFCKATYPTTGGVRPPLTFRRAEAHHAVTAWAGRLDRRPNWFRVPVL